MKAATNEAGAQATPGTPATPGTETAPGTKPAPRTREARAKTAPATNRAAPRHWVSKTLAGALLGLVLALGVSGVVAELAGAVPLVIRAQLVMWLVVPVWLTVFASVYFFRTGARAWVGLGAASALVHGLFFALRAL